MQLLERTSGSYALLTDRRAQPGWLASVPLGIIGLLPLFGEGPLTGLRLSMALTVSSIALALAVRGWPQRIRTSLERSAGKVLVDGRAYEPTAIALGSELEDWHDAAPIFRAALICGSERVPLLEARDPAVLLNMAAELSQWLSVPLKPGFGLDEQAFATSGRRSIDSHEPRVLRATVFPSQRGAAFTALGSTVFVLGFTTMLLTSRLERQLPILGLSLVLPALTILYGFCVSGWLLGLRARIEVSTQSLTYTQWLFGRLLRSTELPLNEISAVYAVTPGTGQPSHVVLRHVSAWVALPFSGAPANQLTSVLCETAALAGEPVRRSQGTKNTPFSSASPASG